MRKFYLALPDNKIQLAEFAFWLLTAYALYTWLSLQHQASITADTLWLCEAANRMLSGEKMAQSYYDPNPPLSVILYIPPVLLAKTGLLSLQHAIIAYVVALLAGASFITYKFLRTAPGIEATTAMTATVALAIANTVMTSMSFTERDQIIGIWLVPFVLAQIAITKNWPVSRPLKHVALLIGAVLILVKPHHGLLPTLILLHRACAQKRISLWKDTDFIYLSCAVLLYVAGIALFFQDYTSTILPDVINLYLSSNVRFVIFKSLYYAMLCISVLLIGLIAGKPSWLSQFFLVAALVSIIPFTVQMRGYHYHILPAVCFFWCGTSVWGKEFFQRYMSPHLAMIFVTAFMTIYAFSLTPARIYAPTPKQYAEMPLAKILADCADPCPVFILNDHIEITHQNATYTGKPWASRFPSFWFIPGIYRLEESDPEQFEAYRQKYALMMAEDLNRYKPARVLLGEFPLEDEPFFDFVGFFSTNASFNAAWKHYRHTGAFTLNQNLYFPKSSFFKNRKVTYQIYERIPDR